MRRAALLLLLMIAMSGSLAAQVPTGAIAGTVTDQVGAVLPKAAVSVTNRDTGAARSVQTGPDGSFSVPTLPAGPYDVLIEATGFQPTVSPVDVAVGTTTTVKISLQVSTRQEAVTVTGTATMVDLESNRVQGVVGRTQIENLPLNGRSFLNLAQLQPGVTVNLGNPAQFNAQFNVSVLGGPASHTAITVDGGNVRNPVEGGTGQNFSQEVVQEFQISTANFDLSTGITAFGAINVVTRSGSNDFRGAGYLYFRDHNLAAYPSLARNSLTDDPDFSRKQGGFVLGGPIKKHKQKQDRSISSTSCSPTCRRWRRSERWRRRRTTATSSAAAWTTTRTTITRCSFGTRMTATPTAGRSGFRCRRPTSCRTTTGSTSSSSGSPASCAAIS